MKSYERDEIADLALRAIHLRGMAEHAWSLKPLSLDLIHHREEVAVAALGEFYRALYGVELEERDAPVDLRALPT